MKIGILSDTHMIKECIDKTIPYLKDCDLIIHAGDIGKFEVIENLKKISHVEYIRGNCDRDKNIAKGIIGWELICPDVSCESEPNLICATSLSLRVDPSLFDLTIIFSNSLTLWSRPSVVIE